MLDTLCHLGYKQFSLQDLTSIIATNCDDCSYIENHKRPRTQAPGITFNPTTTNTMLYIDHKLIGTRKRLERWNDNKSVGEIDNWDNIYCLSIYEPLSGHVFFSPVPTTATKYVKAAIRSYFIQNGESQIIVADNAACLGSDLELWLSTEFNVKLFHTSVYNPKANLSERAHRAFNTALDSFSIDKNQYGSDGWEDCLTKLAISLNSEPSKITGYTPFEVYKNRQLLSLNPTKFHASSIDSKCCFLRFAQKVKNIASSRLKIVSSVYEPGQRVKIKFKNQNPRYGTVKTTDDNTSALSVKVQMDQSRNIVSVNKNFIYNPIIDNSPITVPP